MSLYECVYHFKYFCWYGQGLTFGGNNIWADTWIDGRNNLWRNTDGEGFKQREHKVQNLGSAWHTQTSSKNTMCEAGWETKRVVGDEVSSYGILKVMIKI